MSSRQRYSLIGIIAVSVLGLIWTFVAGNEPLLGLDLQGGASVVLEPTEDVESDQIDQAIEIIRNRVDAIGVAEPEISRQGGNILVQLPGVDDQDRALELVGQTAELRFRPVIADFGLIPVTDEAREALEESATSTTGDPSTSGDAGTTVPGSTAPATTVPASTLPSTTEAPTTSDAPTTSGDTDASVPPTSDGPSTTFAPPEPATADPAASMGTPERCLAEFMDREFDAIRSENGVSETNEDGITDPAEDRACDLVTLAGLPDDSGFASVVLLGPTSFTGNITADAQARLDSGATWRVELDLNNDGNSLFNELAAICFSGNPQLCPTQRIAAVLDSVVLTSPTVQAPEFTGLVQVTGDFDEGESKDLALALRYGALPVELEVQTSQKVSATLGTDARDAGIIAGLVGLGLVALFIIGYYRALGVIAMLSLAISGALLWTIISWLGESQGLALTLAGITGLIVSIGVSVDSNIVYFEHLREDVRNGRTPRSAVDKAFPVAFSTIVKADVASLIGAALLFFLTVGAVRGFAFYLGLATILDLVATYFFMGPAVRFLTRSASFDEDSGKFGIPPRLNDDLEEATT